VRSVDTEGLEVLSVFTNTPGHVASGVRGSPRTIVEAYNDYLGHRCPSWGDAVYLTGSLEAGMFELVSLSVVLAPETERFLVLYTVDCADGWLSVSRHVQGVVVQRME
jgi:hypothetical protein